MGDSHHELVSLLTGIRLRGKRAGKENRLQYVPTLAWSSWAQVIPSPQAAESAVLPLQAQGLVTWLVENEHL